MELKKPKMPNISYLKNYSLIEKWFLIYSFLLIILLVALPLFKTWSLSSSETVNYWFFSLGMIKTNILALIALLTLLSWNLSASVRTALSKFAWFRSSNAFVNFFCLFALILLIFGIWDTVSVIESNFSQRVSTTSSYYIVLIYLIIGLILAWYLAYSTSGDIRTQEEKIEVPHEEDHRQTDAFKKVEEEFSGLFNEQRASDTPTPPQAPPTPRANQSSDFVR